MYKKKLILLAAIFHAFTCFPQEGILQLYQNGYYIKQYSEVSGLVNNSCKKIYQDSKGFMWIATFQGLSRFDGKNFINYGIKQGLPGLDISQVCEDSAGYIYIATTKGIVRYTGSRANNDSCFYPYKQTINLGSAITGMQAIDSTTIIFQRRDNKLYSLQKNKLTVLWDKTQQYVTSIFKDRENNIYAYTMDTIRLFNKYLRRIQDVYFPNKGFISLYYDKNENSIQAYSNSNNFQLNKRGLTSGVQAPDSVLWFCKPSTESMLYFKGRSELLFYDGKVSNRIVDLSSFSLYSNDLIRTNDGAMWVATNAGGLIKITRLPYTEEKANKGGYISTINGRATIEAQNDLLNIPSVAATYKNLEGTSIRTVFAGKDGTIWFCTGKGLYKQPPGKKAEHYFFEGGDIKNYGAIANEIRGVVEDTNQDLWFYGYSGIIHYSKNKFKQYTTRNGLNKDILIRFLVVDKSGTVLLNDFFNLYKVQGDSVIPIGNKLGLSNYMPSRIKTDNNGVAWIDYNKKLYKLEKNKEAAYIITDSIVPYAENISPEIANFGFDGQNNCWVGYSGGKIQVFFSDGTGHYKPSNSVNYTIDDGLTSVTAGQYHFLPDRAGNMTISPMKTGNEKIFTFTIANALQRKKLQTPQVNLTDVLVNRRRLEWASISYSMNPDHRIIPTRFKHTDDDITFNYTGILLSSPSDVIYEIMLKGYDEDWHITTETTTGYTNLPPGDYTFLVKAANGNGVWSEPLKYSFIILPPWYKTWWAISLWVLLTIGIILSLFRLRLNMLRKNFMLSNLQSSNLFKSQLIGMLGHDMMTPLKYIAKVALQLRTYNDRLSKETTLDSLKEINATATQLHFFSESIIHWIKLQGQGFTQIIQQFNVTSLVNELVEFHMHLAAEKDNSITTNLPADLSCTQDPILIKILLHNLLLNANKFSSKGEISISGGVENQWLNLVVQDTGKGMEPHKVESLNRSQPISSSQGTEMETGWGMGYVVIIDLLKFSKGSLQVESELNVGTKVSIKLPLLSSFKEN